MIQLNILEICHAEFNKNYLKSIYTIHSDVAYVLKLNCAQTKEILGH
jgi:hypothetical protein